MTEVIPYDTSDYVSADFEQLSMADYIKVDISKIGDCKKVKTATYFGHQETRVFSQEDEVYYYPKTNMTYKRYKSVELDHLLHYPLYTEELEFY